eukprot:SAG25_NODE_41_length_19492_cov_407.631671_5_plen_96_part_00
MPLHVQAHTVPKAGAHAHGSEGLQPHPPEADVRPTLLFWLLGASTACRCDSLAICVSAQGENKSSRVAGDVSSSECVDAYQTQLVFMCTIIISSQ